MGGCFKSIGCLVVAVVFAATAWFTRGYWTPYVREYTQAALPAHVRTPGHVAAGDARGRGARQGDRRMVSRRATDPSTETSSRPT